MMNKRLILTICVSLFLCAAPSLADIAEFGDAGIALQDVFNDITKNTSGDDPGDTDPPGNPSSTGIVPSSVDVTNEAVSDSLDSLWNIGATNQSAATIVIELATFETTNSFGVYDGADKDNKVQLFGGASDAGDAVTLGIFDAGGGLVGIEINSADTGKRFATKNIGYYLHSPSGSPNTDGYWYSNTAYNADELDHMYAYQGEGDTVKLPTRFAGIWGSNEYILAWEDLYGPYHGDGETWVAGRTSDRDFTDFVVMVESVNPVPVPGAILLGMLGLGAVGIKLRKFA